jgi:hypothetical protein
MNETPDQLEQDPLKPIGIEDVVSGQFDQEADGVVSPLITKRVLPPQAESPLIFRDLRRRGCWAKPPPPGGHGAGQPRRPLPRC